MYVEVIVEIGVKAVDKVFTYAVTVCFREKVSVGARVRVTFGRQQLEGFVLKIIDFVDVNYEVKEILELVDEVPILNEEMLLLGDAEVFL